MCLLLILFVFVFANDFLMFLIGFVVFSVFVILVIFMIFVGILLRFSKVFLQFLCDSVDCCLVCLGLWLGIWSLGLWAESLKLKI